MHAHNGRRPSRDEFFSGVRACLPVVLGYVAIGVAFGVVARSTGLVGAEVALMSAVLYSGTAQFVATGLIGVQAPVFAIVVTVFLVNLRHLLYSAALAPRLRGVSVWQSVLVGAQLTDETFAVAAGRSRGDGPLSAAWTIGLNITAQLTWVLASIAGAVLGQFVPNTEALGLDFALGAMFAALLVLQVMARPRVAVALLVAVLGAVSAVAGAFVMPASWAIILAAVMAASVGVVVETWR